MKMSVLVVASCAMAVASCASTPRVSFDADPQANFASYHTYGWAYSSAPPGTNPLLLQRVHNSIDNALAARGFTRSEQGDFAVGFTLGARNRVEVSSLGTYGSYYRPWGGWGAGWGGGYNQVDVRNVTDGMLVIDIYDSTTKKPVWHGTATQQIDSDKVSQETVDAAVAAVLAKFPPSPGTAR